MCLKFNRSFIHAVMNTTKFTTSKYLIIRGVVIITKYLLGSGMYNMSSFHIMYINNRKSQRLLPWVFMKEVPIAPFISV